ncbi:sensor histidine kinase [Streptomyces sp. NPDC008079]|uniref:sensor histidine kinase n=1 Tax=Streptomyces sp. NPDC008079 TaxID=3364806 RepID=UPI0036EEE07D
MRRPGRAERPSRAGQQPRAGRPRRRGLSGTLPATLRGRLALLALVTTVLWVALLTAAFNVALHEILRRQADDLLRTRAAAVAATVDIRADGTIAVREPGDDGALDSGIWIYRGAHVVERPAAPEPLQRRADALAGKGTRFADTSTPRSTRLYAMPLGGGGVQVATVVAAASLEPYLLTARSALAGSLGLALLLVGGVYLVTRMVIGRALRPVSTMSDQASRWSRYGAAQRFGAREARPAELAALAANLDQLLDRQAAVLRHEQQFTAELSHELRNPLARITAETDWLTARPRTADQSRSSHQAIAAAATQMAQICRTLLSEARQPSAAAAGRCAALDVARAVADRSRAEHPEAPPVTASGEPVDVGVTPELLERVLAPLLDNARRYAARAIALECVRLPDGARVFVADDGPGVPAEHAEAVFEAGRRFGSETDAHDGAGLGLPLARRLARAAGGDITLVPAPRGARFQVTLPPG